MAPRNLRILFVDGQTLIRAGLRMLIETWEEMEVVAESGDEQQALELARQMNPDVVLINLESEEIAPILDFLTDLTMTTTCKALVLTRADHSDFHHLALRHGARGLFVRNQSTEQFRKAILEVGRGEVWIDSQLTTSVITKMTQPHLNGWGNEGALSRDRLSSREQEVAGFVGDGMSNKEIAARLRISENTVRHHMTSIFRKLQINSRLALVISFMRPPLGGLAFQACRHTTTAVGQDRLSPIGEQ